jgi:tetratricopeptide (TPR) repeat protein
MLLQIEILLRVASVCILAAAPIVRLWRWWNWRSQTIDSLNEPDRIVQQDALTDDDWSLGDAEIIDTNHDFSADDALIGNELEQEHYDPVIAAMKQEEEHEQEQMTDSEEIIKEDETEEEYYDETIDNTTYSDDTISQEEEQTIEQTIEVFDIDMDGDGIIDETIVIQTTSVPTDLAETKRQKSLEMMQFELRHLKDKGQISSYEKKLIEARALHPDRSDFTTMLADHYYEQGEQKKALGLYRALVSADSTDDKSLSMVANCYIKLGEWENAQIILEKLVQDKSENPRYRMSLAEVYYNNKEVDRTIECVRTMVKLRPTNADYLSTLAQLYHESAYYDLYVQILYRMLELDPLNHEIKAEIEKYS